MLAERYRTRWFYIDDVARVQTEKYDLTSYSGLEKKLPSLANPEVLRVLDRFFFLAKRLKSICGTDYPAYMQRYNGDPEDSVPGFVDSPATLGRYLEDAKVALGEDAVRIVYADDKKLYFPTNALVRIALEERPSKKHK
ncbi:hypothetical protein JW711_01065 [Candidatus Woesearchaeota archaeon]|nr:hypothetical protein [Candidatus Woesearchaeota archaeon]